MGTDVKTLETAYTSIAGCNDHTIRGFIHVQHIVHTCRNAISTADTLSLYYVNTHGFYFPYMSIKCLLLTTGVASWPLSVSALADNHVYSIRSIAAGPIKLFGP